MAQNLFKHILLADDDLDDCDFFSEVFSADFPYIKLSISNDGSKLLTHLKSPPEPKADLVFLDLNMPVMSGPECLEIIRESAALKDHVIIIFTTSSSHSDILKMYELGANYFITKPNDYRDLEKLISKAMSLISETGSKQPAFENFYIKI